MTNSSFHALAPLDQIELALRDCDYDVAYFEAPEHGDPVQQLMVLELKDQEGQEYPVRLYYLDEIAIAFLKQTQAKLDPGPNKILCLAMNLPFQIFEFQLPELAPLVTACNTLLPAIHLTLGSEEGLILQYRYIHEAQKPDLKVVVEIIETLMTHFRLVLPLFWSYFNANTPAIELMKRIQNQLQLTGVQA